MNDGEGQAALTGFGERLDKVEKLLGLIHQELAAQRAAAEAAAAALERLERRFDPPDA